MPFFKVRLVFSPISKARREVDNFIKRKNTHPQVFGVKELITLSVYINHVVEVAVTVVVVVHTSVDLIYTSFLFRRYIYKLRSQVVFDPLWVHSRVSCL